MFQLIYRYKVRCFSFAVPTHRSDARFSNVERVRLLTRMAYMPPLYVDILKRCCVRCMHTVCSLDRFIFNNFVSYCDDIESHVYNVHDGND